MSYMHKISRTACHTRRAVMTIVAIVVLCWLLSLCGCNTEWIYQQKQVEDQVAQEIAELEAEIVGKVVRLESLPMTDEDAAVLSASIESDKVLLTAKQKKLGKVTKERAQAQQEDDKAFDEAADAAGSIPLYGTALVALMGWGRSWWNSKIGAKVVRSVQPLLDAATPKQKQAVKDLQCKATQRFVDGCQGKKTSLPI